MISTFFYKLLTILSCSKIFLLLNTKTYLTLFLKSDIRLTPLLAFFKKHSSTRQTMLTELTVYDEPGKINRFTFIYFLLSIEYNNRLCIKIPSLYSYFESVSKLYLNSSWSEREIRDMFGIFFTNNNDLRRLLTDYGFEGFPLRKDFPLTGYIEVRYDDEVQQILYEPVELAQEFRLFSLTSPWI